MGAGWEGNGTTEYTRSIEIPIDGVTSPSGENKHKFWDNFCIL